MMHSFVSLRTGFPQKLQPPMEGYYDGLPLATQTMLDKVLRASAIGGQDAVERGLRAFIEKTGADEIIITCQMFDHEARKRSYAIAMDAARAISGEVSLAWFPWPAGLFVTTVSMDVRRVGEEWVRNS